MERNCYRYTRLFCKVEDFASIGHPKDEYGFTRHDSKLINVDNLLKLPVAVIVAPAWLGKSYLANEGIPRHLSYHMPDTKLIRSSFEHGYGKLTSTHFADLRNSEQKTVWIIDSLDEAEKQCFGKWIEDLAELAGNNPKNNQIIVTTRPSTEKLPKTIDLLQQINPQVQKLDLLPMDQLSAADLVGTENLFEDICSTVRDNKGLQGLIGLPCILGYLRENSVEVAELDDVSIWKRILLQLISAHHFRNPEKHFSAEDLFDAVAQLAVVMTFSGTSTISIDHANPSYIGKYCSQELQQYVLDSLCSDVFSPPVGKSYRFTKKNVQDWMCAWGLQKLSFNQLKSLITDRNEFRSDLNDVIHFLARISEKTNPELSKGIISYDPSGIIPSPMVPWNKQDGIRILDFIEYKVCDNRDWYFDLWGQENVRNLSGCEITVELGNRISDKRRPISARAIYIEIAKKTNSSKLIPTMLGIIKDEKEPARLRHDAVSFVIEAGSHDRALLDFVTIFLANDPHKKALLSTILNHLFNNETIDLVTVVKYAPEVDSDWKVIDATSLLHHTIESKMTHDDAKELATKDWWESRILSAVRKNHRDERNSRRKNRAESKFFDLISSSEKYDTVEFNLICTIFQNAHQFNYWFLNHDTSLLAPIGNSQTHRKKFYLHSMPNRFKHLKHYVLKTCDHVWLRELLQNDPSNEDLFSHLYYLAHREGQTNTAAILEFLNTIDSDRVQLFENNRAKEDQRKAEREKLKEIERKEKTNITTAVAELLNAETISLHKKMQELSFLCFCKDFSASNIDGNWEDIDEPLQKRVVDICNTAFSTCSATPLPDESSIPGSVWTEAYCFSRFATEGWIELNAVIVRTWLPSVLKCSARNEEVISECHLKAPAETEKILIEKLCLEGSESGHFIVGRDISGHIWNDQFSKDIVQEIIQNEKLNPEYRADALRVLKQENSEIGSDCANQIIDSGTSVLPILGAAIDVLLVSGHTEVLEQLEIQSDCGTDLLQHINSIANHLHYGLSVDWKQWTAEQVTPLLSLLFEIFNPKDDPEREHGSFNGVSKNDSWRELRNNMFHHVFLRNGMGDRVLCRQLAGTHTKSLEFMEYWERREKLNMAFGANVNTNSNGTFPAEHIVDLIQQQHRRICETENHLNDTILEELNRIQKNIGRHNYLFFKEDENGVLTRRPRHETVLQQYVACRLEDRLNDILISRETEVHFGNKTDLEISTFNGTKHLTVVIEIKWSTNPELSTSLTEQLGKKYLIDRTHGIYLVGYTGTQVWHKQQLTGRSPKDLLSLTQRLEEQALTYEASEPDKRISVHVLDLTGPSKN
jgi:hypothetical protein